MQISTDSNPATLQNVINQTIAKQINSYGKHSWEFAKWQI